MAGNAQSRAGGTACRHCGKVLKTAKGRKLHERTCAEAKAQTRVGSRDSRDASADASGGELEDIRMEEESLEEAPLPLFPDSTDAWPPISGVGAPRLESELEDVKVELGGKLDADTSGGVRGRRGDVRRQLEVLDEKATTITNTLGEFTAKAIARFEEFQEELDARATARDLDRLTGELEKLDDKLAILMEEVGHGVTMDISKIPPHILEGVYQSTLDDVLRELRKTFGPHDTEILVQEVKEEVRLKTSGSELFHFDPPNLRLKGLSLSIEKGLISARQVHTTYVELLKKLQEPIPHYRPKNFGAMLRVKSQEYAVDRSSSLAENIGDMKALAREAVDGVEVVRTEIEERLAALSGEVATAVERLDELSSLPELVRAIEDRLTLLEDRTPSEDAEAATVLKILPEQGYTAKRTFRELKGDVPEETVLETLEDLVERGLVEKATRGRWTVFRPVGEAEPVPAEAPVRLSLNDLEEGPRSVYDAVGRGGRTLNGLRRALQDEVKYTDLLKALRILLDGGLVTTTERGRHTVYIQNEQKEAEEHA